MTASRIPDLMNQPQQTSLFDQPTNEDSAPSAPFRTEPRVADQETIAKRNQEEDNERARRYLGVERARRMASQQNSANEDRQKSWVYHPDERVVLSFLGNPEAGEIFKSTSFSTREEILKRGLDINQEENIHWNPILDRLARHGHWPYSYVGSHSKTQESKWPQKGEVLEELVPWIQDQTDPRKVEELLEFEFNQVGEVVARETRCVDEKFIERILKTPAWGDELAENPSLTPKQVTQIVDWSMSKLSDQWAKESGRQGAPRSSGRRGFGYRRNRRSSAVPRNAAATLKTLKSSGHPIGGDAVKTLKELVTSKTTPKTTDRSSGWRRNHDRSPRGLAYSVLMHMEDEITSEDLLELYPHVANDSRQTNKIVEHSVATPDVWSEIAQDSSLFKVRKKLGRLPEARQVDQVREVLFSSSSTDVMVALCKEASSGRLQALFDDLYQEEPSKIIKMMLEGEIENLQQLDQKREFRRAFEVLKVSKPQRALNILLEKPEPWTNYLNWEEELKASIEKNIQDRPGSLASSVLDGDLEDIEILDPKEIYCQCLRTRIEDNESVGWQVRRLLEKAQEDLNGAIDKPLAALIIEHSSGRRQGEFVIQIPVLREDPEAREIIIQKGSSGTKVKLMPYVEGEEEFQRLFRALAEQSPREAILILEEQEHEVLDRVTANELVPLLQHEDSQLRQRAMMATSKRQTPQADPQSNQQPSTARTQTSQ